MSAVTLGSGWAGQQVCSDAEGSSAAQEPLLLAGFSPARLNAKM